MKYKSKNVIKVKVKLINQKLRNIVITVKRVINQMYYEWNDCN